MTETAFEERLVEAVEDCAKSLRAQVKIMQDRNFLLEQSNLAVEESVKLQKIAHDAYQEKLNLMSKDNLEKLIYEILVEAFDKIKKEEVQSSEELN